jgi:hypothetical protein
MIYNITIFFENGDKVPFWGWKYFVYWLAGRQNWGNNWLATQLVCWTLYIEETAKTIFEVAWLGHGHGERTKIEGVNRKQGGECSCSLGCLPKEFDDVAKSAVKDELFLKILFGMKKSFS